MIHENNLFSLDVPEKGVAKGHVRMKINSASPEDMIPVGLTASIAASVLFEKLSAQGTNIILTVKDSEAQADIIARYENDGLDLLWQGKEIDQNQMSTYVDKIKDALDEGAGPVQTSRPKDSPPDAPNPQESSEDDEYLVKQINRIP